jgi:hypothetical protein
VQPWKQSTCSRGRRPRMRARPRRLGADGESVGIAAEEGSQQRPGRRSSCAAASLAGTGAHGAPRSDGRDPRAAHRRRAEAQPRPGRRRPRRSTVPVPSFVRKAASIARVQRRRPSQRAAGRSPHLRQDWAVVPGALRSSPPRACGPPAPAVQLVAASRIDPVARSEDADRHQHRQDDQAFHRESMRSAC